MDLFQAIGDWLLGAGASVGNFFASLSIDNIIMLVFIGLLGFLLFYTIKVMRAQSALAGRSKEKTERFVPSTNWADIAGCDEAIDSLKEVVGFLTNPEKFARLGARVPKGVLLHGPPGTGKTLLAKAVAGTSGSFFFSETGSGFVNTYVGTGAARVRQIFAAAKKCEGPAVVFIDEIDAIGGKRRGDGHPGQGEYEKTLNELLAALDGFEESQHPLLLIAATNLASNLDPALLRPGRIDRKIQVPLPDLKGREKILRIHIAGKPIGPDVDLASLARRTTGMSGAELANICNEAAIFAGRRGATFINQKDLLDAVRHEVVGQATKRPLNDREKKIVAYHEAGHAVIGMVEPHLEDPIESITIVPHSSGSLGHTLTAAGEDRHLDHRRSVEARLRMLMGGRAAELYIGEETNGASGDLQHAYKLAKGYMAHWGWGDDKVLWPVGSREISDLTVHELDKSASALASKSLQDACSILQHHHELLEELAITLLDQETIEREQIEAIGKRFGVAPKSAHDIPAPI